MENIIKAKQLFEGTLCSLTYHLYSFSESNNVLCVNTCESPIHPTEYRIVEFNEEKVIIELHQCERIILKRKS